MRLGNSSWRSIGGPTGRRSSSSRPFVDRDRALRVADRDVLEAPLAPVGGERAGAVVGSARVVARSAAARGPCPPGSVVGPRIVGRISPAAVWIEKVSESVQPRSRRYMIASRAPLPDSSASEPSGLKMRSRATKPRSSGGCSSSTPSAPTPVWGAHSAAHALGGELPGQVARPRRSRSRCRAPATSRTGSGPSRPATLARQRAGDQPVHARGRAAPAPPAPAAWRRGRRGSGSAGGAR